MDERIEEIIRQSHDVALVLCADDNPLRVEEGKAIDALITGFERLRKVAMATGIPENLVDKIALDEL